MASFINGLRQDQQQVQDAEAYRALVRSAEDTNLVRNAAMQQAAQDMQNGRIGLAGQLADRGPVEAGRVENYVNKIGSPTGRSASEILNQNATGLAESYVIAKQKEGYSMADPEDYHLSLIKQQRYDQEMREKDRVANQNAISNMVSKNRDYQDARVGSRTEPTPPSYSDIVFYGKDGVDVSRAYDNAVAEYSNNKAAVQKYQDSIDPVAAARWMQSYKR